MIEPVQNHSQSHLFGNFSRVAERYAERPALVSARADGAVYSYAATLEAARTLARNLLQEPYASAKEIGILAENRPEWVISYLAIVAAGKTVVPIDANLTRGEIEALISHCGLGTIFCSDKLMPQLSGTGDTVQVIQFDTDGAGSFAELSATPPTNESNLPVMDNSLAALIYTSGTTGAPKAVMLTHENLLSNLVQAKDTLEFGTGDTFLSILPLHHTFEATCGFLAPLMSGAKVVYARSLKSKEILADIRAHDVTVMCGVPLLYEKMYHSISRAVASAPAYRRILFRSLYALSERSWHKGKPSGRKLFSSLRQKAGLDTIRLFVSGGAALPAEIGKFFNLLGMTLVQGYGMTECSPVVSVNRPPDIEFGSVGPPLEGVTVRINEPNDEGIGEILVQGPNVTPGYRDNPAATAELLRDGWLYTGDIGHMEKGHVWITGRAKNVIVSAAGKNIYPEELEEKLALSLFILESLVLGRKKQDKQGEEVCAILVPDMEQFAQSEGCPVERVPADRVEAILAEEVAKVNKSVASFKKITSHEIRYEELEKTSTKKIRRYLFH